MTEQTTGAYDEPVPSGIVDAAARARLGKHRATYLGAQPQGRSNTGATITVVVSGVLAVVLVVAGAGGWAVLPVVMIALVLIGYWMEASTAKRNEDLRLDLYEHGLAAGIAGRVHTVRYDTTSVLQEHIRHSDVLTHYTVAYTVTDVDGQAVVLRGRAEGPEGGGEIAQRGKLSSPREWGPAILRGVTDAQLPQAVATLNAGERLVFGDLWLTTKEVGSTRASVSAPWPEIEQIKIRDGAVELRITGARKPLTRVSVSKVPNFDVFHTLAEHLRR